mmetsp:Transcript_22405/g.68250  ORF Transcript_22405/g.68250 Transcript_22405/m.68250 type:complete len:101 (+) Transcript_22405:945-1247(+)|eukprot:scaffold311327_cov30-Tisochrysis_lutea.AAC.2
MRNRKPAVEPHDHTALVVVMEASRAQDPSVKPIADSDDFDGSIHASLTVPYDQYLLHPMPMPNPPSALFPHDKEQQRGLAYQPASHSASSTGDDEIYAFP